MLLRKGVYPYEYMDGWDKFNEKIIPGKELFYSKLTLENISETDYAHASNVFKKFNINNLGEYHDLYFRSDTLVVQNGASWSTLNPNPVGKIFKPKSSAAF